MDITAIIVFQSLLLLSIALPQSISLPEVVDHSDESGRRLATASSWEDPAPDLTTLQSHEPVSHNSTRFVTPARRKLGLFRECAPCKCCSDNTRRYCYYTACCYRIDCFAPGLSFGHCSFVPVTCNCLRC